MLDLALSEDLGTKFRWENKSAGWEESVRESLKHPRIDLPDWLEGSRTQGPVPESLRRVQSSVASSFSRGSASPISVQSARLFQ